MPQRGPTAYVFDAYGTLFDVHSAVARHADRVGPDAARLSEHWRIKQLEYCWVRTLGGCAVPRFRRAHRGGPGSLSPSLSGQGSERARRSSRRLSSPRRIRRGPGRSGAPAGRWTSPRDSLERHASHARCRARLGEPRRRLRCVISVDAVGRYKTAPEVYALAGERLDAEAGAISFQSSNRWDIAGARLAGFHTVWVNRAASPEDYPDCPPHRVIASLAEL